MNHITSRSIESFTRSDRLLAHARFFLSTNDQISLVCLSNLLQALQAIALHALVDNKTVIGKAVLEKGTCNKIKVRTNLRHSISRFY